MEEADMFISKFDRRIIAKLLYNIDLAEKNLDSRLFKKLNNNIWEFRLRYEKMQIRLWHFGIKRIIKEL